VAYSIDFKPAALRQFARLSRKVQHRLKPRIDALAEDPRPPGAKKLSGREPFYRIRVGDYRVVYRIQDQEGLVLVLRVAHRKEAYSRSTARLDP